MSERDQVPVDELLSTVAEREQGESEDLDREYREILGLLPYALAPVQPRMELKAQLMAGVAGIESVGSSVRSFGSVEVVSIGESRVDTEVVDPSGTAAGAVVVDFQPAASQAGEVQDSSIESPQLQTRTRASWIPSALAAALVVSLLGVALLAGRLQEQSRQIETLNLLRADSTVRIAGLEDRTRELDRTRDRLTMVTTIARKAYPLKTVVETGARRAASGIVYVCGNHQRWYLSLQGLDPPPPGDEYNLWFVTAEGSVNAGVLEVGVDSSAELEAPSMPLGTEGFAVSLEHRGTHEKPEGIMVLLGENSVSL